jgi:hypothetical protein
MSNASAVRTSDQRTRVWALQRCMQHLHVWLATVDATYGAESRAEFARSHPMLFGRAYEITLRGYSRWHIRHGLRDSTGTFARCLTPRHERWLRSLDGEATAIAPCLLGSGTHGPCWHRANS